MKTRNLLAAGIVAVFTILSCKKQNDPAPKPLSAADLDFISKAGPHDTAQVLLAKAVIGKTSDSVVLSFANYLLTEHRQAINDLKIMGTIVGFTTNNTVDPATTSMINDLNTLSGRTFDSTFIHRQLADQQATIKFYKDEVINGSQINVTHYANAYLQSYSGDLQRADSIATALF